MQTAVQRKKNIFIGMVLFRLIYILKIPFILDFCKNPCSFSWETEALINKEFDIYLKPLFSENSNVWNPFDIDLSVTSRKTNFSENSTWQIYVSALKILLILEFCQNLQNCSPKTKLIELIVLFSLSKEQVTAKKFLKIILFRLIYILKIPFILDFCKNPCS